MSDLDLLSFSPSAFEDFFFSFLSAAAGSFDFFDLVSFSFESFGGLPLELALSPFFGELLIVIQIITWMDDKYSSHPIALQQENKLLHERNEMLRHEN